MVGEPTMSPDGKWMWNGADWIPAPPSHDPASFFVTSSKEEQTISLVSDNSPAGLSSPSIEQSPSIESPLNPTNDTESGFKFEAWMMCVSIAIILFVFASFLNVKADGYRQMAHEHYNHDCNYIPGTPIWTDEELECKANHERIADDNWEKYLLTDGLFLTAVGAGIWSAASSIGFKVKPEISKNKWFVLSGAVLGILATIFIVINP